MVQSYINQVLAADLVDLMEVREELLEAVAGGEGSMIDPDGRTTENGVGIDPNG